MSFIIGLLTVVLVLNCLVLILLVLIQLPKKEAGLGVAFGSSATDALFGAGSGNVLTKMTKYAAGLFFGLALVLGILQSNYHRQSSSEFKRQVDQQTRQPAGGLLPPPSAAPSAPTAVTNLPVLPSTPASNPPAAAPATTPATPVPTAPVTPK